MKKILALILAVMMLFALVACGDDANTTTTADNVTTGGNVTPAATPFDAENIVLSFAAISDTQHKYSGIDTLSKFAAALAQLDAAAMEEGDGLDAILFVGDLVQNAQTTQVEEFKATYESIISPSAVPLIFSLGNHDVDCEAGYTYEKLTMESFYNIFGDAYRSYEEETSNLSIGCTHTIVNGYHFLCINPIDKEYIGTDAGGVLYSAEAKNWLDTTLAKITAENPGQYVFLNTHPMLYDTTYGSTLLTGNHRWYTKDLTSIVEKYPQVVTFGGHTHFPINDERTIMQTKFTSLGCGSVTYLAIENGYSNVSGTVPGDASQSSAGLLLEVDKNGNIRITRMNFADGTTFKDAWEISAPQADGSHLTKYTKDRANSNKAPEMKGEVKVSTTVVGGNTVGAVVFDAGTDDDFVHHYEIKVTNASTGALVNQISYLTNFYLHSNPKETMPKTYSISLGALPAGAEYKVEVVAVDSWGAKSAAATATASVTADLTSVLPDAYGDFDFVNGEVKDVKGKFSVANTGASIAPTSVTFAGKTATLDAFNVTATGQFATATFNDYAPEDIGKFYNSATGFSFEAFYVNRAQAGTQGILCATEYGGLGLATTGGGKPGLCTYITSTKSYKYTNPAAAASATDLTHVVATAVAYEGKLYTALYVNGELAASNSFDGEVYLPVTDQRYYPYANTLTLGSDSGVARFDMSNFTAVDMKVYDVALNANQVKTAYDNACALFN
ncbi:MAG: hypothetical protein E7608_04595 [Ruminococcaceae bacterium]|nr:hypothetical protein [Oscillospiraceae bacterium]